VDGTPDLDPKLTSLIARFGEGDRVAAASLLPHIYDELRAIAAKYFGHQNAQHTLQPTALVNEAYVKLIQASKVQVRDRKHFFVLAARIMRQIMVDHARAKQAKKRGGGDRCNLTIENVADTSEPDMDVIALEEALERLATMSPERARLVELRFFAGLTSEEAAQVLNISRAEAARRWRAVRAWLMAELRKGDEDER
jgi:RNA polymerase sigma-70 factor, ECF subfamily